MHAKGLTDTNDQGISKQQISPHSRPTLSFSLGVAALIAALLSLPPAVHAQNATYTVCNRSVDERLDANNPTMKFGCGFLKYVVHYHWSDRSANPRLRVKADSLGGSAHGMNQGSVSYPDTSQFDVPEFRTGSATISKWAYYVGEYSHSAEQGAGYYVGTVNGVHLQLQLHRNGRWETVDSVNFLIEHRGTVTAGTRSSGPGNSWLPTAEVHLYSNPTRQAYRISRERGSGVTQSGCTECLCACELDASIGSIDINFGLGRAALVPQRARLGVHAQRPDAALYDSQSLAYSPAEGYHIIRDPETQRALRYVAPDVIVAVDDPHYGATDDGQYQLHYFHRTPGTDGNTPPAGDPYATIKVENPDATGEQINALRVTKTQDGSTDIYDYTFDAETQKWSLTAKEGNHALQYDSERTLPADPNNPADPDNPTNPGIVRTLRDTRDHSGALISQVLNEYKVLRTGRVKVKEIVDPEGSAQTTQWFYNEDTVTGQEAGVGAGVAAGQIDNVPGINYGKLEKVIHADGSWARYAYDDSGRTIKEVTPLLDNAHDSPDAENRVTTTRYQEIEQQGQGQQQDGQAQEQEPIHIKTTIDYVQGQEVSRAFEVIDQRGIHQIIANEISVRWDNPNNTITTTDLYTDEKLWLKTKSQLHPDGTATLYAYEIDGPSLAESTTLTTTTLTGEVEPLAEPIAGNAREGRDQDGQEDVFGIVIKDGIQAIAIENIQGETLAQTASDLQTGTELSRQVVTEVDAYGRPVLIQHQDGTTETKSYDCCGLASETDRHGQTTRYEKLPGQTIVERGGIRQVTITNGLETVHKQIGADGSEIIQSRSRRSLDGRQQTTTNALGHTTTSNETLDAATGSRLRTTRYPDGGSRIETYYRDGRLKSVTGTAVYPVRYEYGIESPGDGLPPQRFTKRIALNRDGSDSAEWSKQYRDARDRVWRTVSPYQDGQNGQPAKLAIHSTHYDQLGRVTRETDPDGITTLHAYTKSGGKERHVIALDLNRNGKIDYSGSDRITETLSERVQLSDQEQRKTTSPTTSLTNTETAAIVQRVTTKTWTTDGDATAARIVSIHESTIDGNHHWQSTADRKTAANSRDLQPGIVQHTHLAADGSHTVTTREQGLQTKSQRYNPAGELIEVTETEYDRHRRLTSRTTNDPQGNLLRSETQSYDPFGRIESSTDQNGRQVRYSYHADGSVASTSITAANKTHTTRFQYDPMGRRTATIRPDGKATHTSYFHTGKLMSIRGAGGYPASYRYDHQGRQRVLSTSAGDTHWQYAPSGQLARKIALDGNSTDYEHTPGGRLKQRTDARGIVTTYQYNAAGELQRIDYSDDTTPSLVYGYNRLGQQTSIVHGHTTYLNEYSDDGTLQKQIISGGPLHGIILEQAFNQNGQRQQFTAQLPHGQRLDQHYFFDDQGRITTVRQDNRQARYTFNTSTGAIAKTQFLTDGQAIAETVREFDAFNRLEQISTRSVRGGGNFHQSFNYHLNAINQRQRVEMADGSYWEYRYDDLGQVISAKRYWQDGQPVAGQQYQYTFDAIGNRQRARYGGDAKGENLAEIRYTKSNTDNTQIGTIDHPGITYVTGTANQSATVTINGQSAERQGTYFSSAVEIDNTAGASIETITLDAREGEGQASDTQRRQIFIPARSTNFHHDQNGNLLFDGRWHYRWNGENRLIEMRSTNVRGGRQLKLEFSYDHQGRRITKRVTETLDGTATIATDLRFVYDGWNLVAELDATGTALRSHLWGLDLSGTPQGAGGVGGLISTATTDRAVFISHDGNGNVTGELDCNTGKTLALTSYDAFGNVVTQRGESNSPFAFSTKYLDKETGLLYYGYRYYDPVQGRWLSRDPIGENGGKNLYGFVINDGFNSVDYLGAARLRIVYSGDDTVNDRMAYLRSKTPSRSSITGEILSTPTGGIIYEIETDKDGNQIEIPYASRLDSMFKAVEDTLEECAKLLKRQAIKLELVKRSSFGKIKSPGGDGHAIPASGEPDYLSTIDQIGQGELDAIPVLFVQQLAILMKMEIGGKEVTLEQTAGARSHFGTGIILNLRTARDSTLAHEIGHFVGYRGRVLNSKILNSQFPSTPGSGHSSDPKNLMASGDSRTGNKPDCQYCQLIYRFVYKKR